MFCLSFIVRSTFQSGHIVALGSTSSVCSSARSPGCLWPCSSWDILCAAAKVLAKIPSPGENCLCLNTSLHLRLGCCLRLGAPPRAVPRQWQQDFMALSRGHVCPSLQVSHNCPQVSAWGMRECCGQQAASQANRMCREQGNDPIYPLKSVSTAIRASPQGWWQMPSASQTFTFFSFTLLAWMIWHLGWAMSKPWSFFAFLHCSQEETLLSAGEVLVSLMGSREKGLFYPTHQCCCEMKIFLLIFPTPSCCSLSSPRKHLFKMLVWSDQRNESVG